MGLEAFERPEGTIMSKIRRDDRTDEILLVVDEKFYPPAGWDLQKAPFKPNYVPVTAEIPEGLADLAHYLAQQQGKSREKYMGILLIEALQEALSRL